MKTLRLLGCLILFAGATHPVMADRAYNFTRPLLGGVVGGLLGSTIGSGSGRDIAIGVGATLGAIYGHHTTQQSDRRSNRRELRRNTHYVPHALYAPIPQITHATGALKCKIIDQKRSKNIYACRNHLGNWELLQ